MTSTRRAVFACALALALPGTAAAQTPADVAEVPPARDPRLYAIVDVDAVRRWGFGVLDFADAIGRLVENAELRKRIVEGGLDTVGAFDWEPELENIARYLEGAND